MFMYQFVYIFWFIFIYFSRMLTFFIMGTLRTQGILRNCLLSFKLHGFFKELMIPSKGWWISQESGFLNFLDIIVISIFPWNINLKCSLLRCFLEFSETNKPVAVVVFPTYLSWNFGLNYFSDNVYFSYHHMKIKKPYIHFIMKNIFDRKWIWGVLHSVSIKNVFNECLTLIYYQKYFLW